MSTDMQVKRRFSVSADLLGAMGASREDSWGDPQTIGGLELAAMTKNAAFIRSRHTVELAYRRTAGRFASWYGTYTCNREPMVCDDIASISGAASDITQGAAPREWYLGGSVECQYLIAVRSRSGRPTIVRVESSDMERSDDGAEWLGALFEEALDRPSQASYRTAARLMGAWTNLYPGKDGECALSKTRRERRLDIQTFLVALETEGAYGDAAREIREQYVGTGPGALWSCATDFLVHTGVRPLREAA